LNYRSFLDKRKVGNKEPRQSQTLREKGAESGGS
jgi:hypothetical protein